MSRIGKKTISIPDGMSVALTDGLVTLKASGKEVAVRYPASRVVVQQSEDGCLVVMPLKKDCEGQAEWGTWRSLIDNAVRGLCKPFVKTLTVRGVGYRAALRNGALCMQLGFSHEIVYPIPDGIEIKVEEANIVVSGLSKMQVGQVASEIRSFRPPEPYKGKGIRYVDEVVLRKDGKKK